MHRWLTRQLWWWAAIAAGILLGIRVLGDTPLLQVYVEVLVGFAVAYNVLDAWLSLRASRAKRR